MFRDAIISLALVHLGLFFSVAGLTKALSPRAFGLTLTQHGLVPKPLCHVTAWIVFIAELFLGVWLVSGIEYHIAAGFATVILGSFLLYRMALRAFGPDGAECGCLGNLNTAGPEGTGVVLNLLVALTVIVIGGNSDRYSMPVSLLLAGLMIVGLLTLVARQKRPVGEAAAVPQDPSA
jgi:hypothetical protein